MRPMLHYTPRRGWINDPNGLIQIDGVHHLYYQTNPEDTRFQSMHWGHATSTDLVHWTEQPIALVPGDPNTDYDRGGCWSGVSVMVDARLALLYTGVSNDDLQLPCLAWATDAAGTTFEKDLANPVISRRPAPADELLAFRDHTVSRTATGWRQLIGGGTRSTGGALFAYTSTDLRDWTFRGRFTDESRTPIPGPVWECPDLFSIEGHTVVIVSTVNPTEPVAWWATGEDTGNSFEPDRIGRLDFGDLFYAPQSYSTVDGRRIMFGWLRTQNDPAAAGADWIGMISLPREITVRDGMLRVHPARELHGLRGPSRIQITGGSATTQLRRLQWDTFDLEIPAALAQVTHTVRIENEQTRESFVVDVAALRGGRQVESPLNLIFDRGIVEAFLDGRAGAWSQSALDRVTRIVVDHPYDAPTAEVVAWRLASDDT
jgi:beta-fructofuranosidase